MKNWEEMRDLTYVSIKSTKAKSITEGMTRCKIDKLTRNNPVYEHIRLHKKRSLPVCHVCRSPQSIKQSPFSPSKKKSLGLNLKVKKEVRSKNEGIEKASQALESQLGLFTERKSQHHELNKRLDKIIEQTPRRPKTPREKVLEEGQRMKNAIDQFDKSMRRSKTHFNHLNRGIDKAESYFLTSFNDIELEINEDKGLSIREVKSDYEKIKKDMNLHYQKMKKMAKKVKQIKKPVIFPFSTQQVHNIINSDNKVKKAQTIKLKRIMTNLYEYKSTKNYSNRMKMVNQIINRQQ